MLKSGGCAPGEKTMETLMTMFGVVCAIAVTSSKPVSLHGSQWTATMTGNILTSSSESNESSFSSEETEGGTRLPLTMLPPVVDHDLPPDGQVRLDTSDRAGELPSSDEHTQTTIDTDPSVLPDRDVSQTSTDLGESNEPLPDSVGTDKPKTFDGEGSLPTIPPLPGTNVERDSVLTDGQFPLVPDDVLTVLSTVSSATDESVDLTSPPVPVVLTPRPVTALPIQPLPAGPGQSPIDPLSCFIVDVTSPEPGHARGDSV